jgi:alpha-beta hydrolase superfamily lysophospholipase
MEYSETKCEVFQADEKTKLLAHIWLPKKVSAIFLAIHGGMAHAGDWVTPALYFKDRGVATFALDLRWHGTYPEYNKGGKVYFHIDSYDEYISDIHNFYLWIRKQYPKIPIFILSHSNGALIALEYVLGVGQQTDIKGIIVSSPWLKNRVEVPAVARALGKVLAVLAPNLALTSPPLTDNLTHDAAITARHHADEESGLRGTKFSPRLGVESAKAQAWVLGNMPNWKKFPLFGVIAGQDRLADPEESEKALGQIPEKLLHLEKYPENYHENFNELNREKIYANIWKWMQKVMK